VALALPLLLTLAAFGAALGADGESRAELVAAALAASGCCAVGAVILSRSPRHRVGALLLALGLLPAVHLATRITAREAWERGWSVLPEAAGWVASWTFGLWLVAFLVLLPLLFPTGHAPRGRWRVVTWATWVTGTLAVAPALAPGPLDLWDGEDFPVDNPLGIGPLGPALDAMGDLFFLTLLLTSMAALASLVTRYARSSGELRQQVRWVLASLVAVAIALLLDEVPAPGSTPEALSAVTSAALLLAVLAVPVSVGVAVLRYRLYDLDLVISRIVVHVALVATIALGYVVAVAASALLFGRDDDVGVGVLASACVGVALHPARTWLLQRINLLTFGFRSSPTEAASHLSQVRAGAASPVALLPRAVEVAAHSLRMPYAVLTLPDGRTVVHGSPAGGELTTLALTRQGEVVGHLAVSSPTRRLLPSDEPLVDEVTRELAACVEAASVHEDLLRSRAALVGTREEERRRLRRDLHDGLGSALTGVVLKLQAAGSLLPAGAERAQALLEQAETSARGALDDVRRLLYELRPPNLDELGLEGAIRSEAAQLAAATSTTIQVETAGELAEVPAAVEVAAYRIVLEALSNVVRHAGATRCTVSVRATGGRVLVEVVDDGRGPAAGWRPGIGTTSMRERAEELGGRFAFEPAEDAGARVRAELPVAS
jgi:signal transduction histidine kinase